jgi:hypothetical protein
LKLYSTGTGSFSVVDDVGFSTLSRGISLAIDKDSNPIIAYQKIQDRARLYIARPYFVYSGIEHGNCGDEILPDYPNRYWFCSRLDPGGQYLDAANYVSLAVNSSGLAQVAFSEFYDDQAGDFATSLKYYCQHFQFPFFLPLVKK